jgi:hypothetical protein
MKFYRFQDPRNFYYARAFGGRTLDSEIGKPCPECGASRVKFKPPFTLEWEPGSDIIGDFTFPGLGETIIIKDSVKTGFESRFHDFELFPIEFRQDPKLRKPTRITKRTQPRIWLPYTGSALWELEITKWCRLELEKSGVTLEKICFTCGREIFLYDSSSTLRWVVDAKTWAGEDFFHLFESRRWIFCSEKVKSFIEQSGFSNVKFIEYGIIPE